MAADVAIIDSGGANIASLEFALARLGASSLLTADHALIRRAPRVILPGVGAAADAMQRLAAAGLDRVIPTLTQPVLGICLGMQLLGSHSAEDDTACLGILPAPAQRLPVAPDCPVPNMGWCRVSHGNGHPLLDGIEDGSWFYFVHSYALPDNPASIGTARHSDAFCAIAAQDNFHATQFHPERSAGAGARLLENFLGLPV